MRHSKIIYLGIKGSVIAMDAATGGQLWVVHLKGSDFVSVVLDGDNLYATTYGEIFCLDPATGEGRWHNKLKGFGLGLITIAGDNGCADHRLVSSEEKRRQDARNSNDSSPSPSD